MSEEVKIDNNTDIDQALKEFEAKSVAEETPSISEVSKDSEMPRMVRWIIKLSGGAIKDQRQAEYVLLGLVVLMFAVSFYFFLGTGNSRPAISPNDLICGFHLVWF